LANFNAQQKLKQATYTFIVSQLLTKQEKEKIDCIFRAMDTDCDGKLSKEEIKKGYMEHFGRDIADDEIDTIFSRVDSDMSGEIDYSEFVVATMNEKNLLSQNRLETAFKAFDKDGNGQISPDEIKVILGYGQAGGLDKKTVEKIIEQVDENGDGEISFEEFASMMLKNILS
jgi:calcium-dependent protein kinase